MNKLRGLALLMGITILGITGFQLYWLKENYDREKKSLAIKSEAAFRETIFHLQVAKLKLDLIKGDTPDRGHVRLIMTDNKGGEENIHFSPGKIVSTINVIRDKLTDSIKKEGGFKKSMIISMDKSSLNYRQDSIKFRNNKPQPDGEHILNMLYGVDSLQDSLKLPEINAAYTKAIKGEKLNVPFTILRLDTSDADDTTFNQVTVGFAKPITYKLQLGNTVPYLIKRITLPILFSLLLLGITLLSFVLLYRSLLKQRRLAELKNEFISNITHELKTPIATVGVAIEALKNFNAMEDPQRTKEYLDISSNELQRLSLLVDKVLKLSMFEKKEVELKVEPVNLKEVVEEVVNSMRLQLEKHHAQVSITTEGDVFIQGDKLHLQSVVFNLLDNAIKYNKGNPAIQIGIKEQGIDVVMSVTDNGIGIPPEYKDKVFDKFFRIPHGDTHDAKGYGLGLSYVAHVVKKHLGTISVETQPGIGTNFTITLPKTDHG